MMRFSDDEFSDAFITTIGVDFRFKTIEVDRRTVKLQIWDTAGWERCKTTTSGFYSNAHGILILYDLTNEESFLKVREEIGCM